MILSPCGEEYNVLRKKNNIIATDVAMEKISLSSLAIVLINFIVACSRFNNTDSMSIDVCAFDFLVLIILLLLNSIDILKAHKDYTSGCIKVERFVSVVSLVLSALIIVIALGKWLDFWNIDEGILHFEGKLSSIHSIIKTQAISLDFVIELYFISCIMQLIAKLFKFKIDNDIKKEILKGR